MAAENPLSPLIAPAKRLAVSFCDIFPTSADPVCDWFNEIIVSDPDNTVC